MRQIQAIVFDFDGLILDTEVPEFQAWQEIYRQHGCELPFSSWARCIGGTADMFDPYADLEDRLGRPVDRAGVGERRRRRHLELVRAQPLLPGVRAYIEDARRLGLKLGVASNSPRRWVAGHLARLGLMGEFQAIRCIDDVSRGKPDPEIYRSVTAALDVRPHAAIALEDSPHGVQAAKAAGLFCVAVPNTLTRQLALDQADLRLDCLADRPLGQLLGEVAAMLRPGPGPADRRM